jgi:hypothetical protein
MVSILPYNSIFIPTYYSEIQTSTSMTTKQKEQAELVQVSHRDADYEQ